MMFIFKRENDIMAFFTPQNKQEEGLFFGAACLLLWKKLAQKRILKHIQS